MTRSTPVGHRHHLAGRDGDLVGVPAAGEQGADLVARPRARRRRSPTAATVPLHSRPRMSEAPGRRRVEALPLQEVGPVDRGGGDVDQDLAAARLGVGHVGVLQDLGAARLPDDDGRAFTRRTRRRVWSTPRVVGDVVVDVDGVGGARRAVPVLGERLGPGGQPLDLLGSASACAGGVPEQVRRDRRRRPVDVVGGHLAPGRGPAPRRPRSRCRGRRTARRSSRAGSRCPILRNGGRTFKSDRASPRRTVRRRAAARRSVPGVDVVGLVARSPARRGPRRRSSAAASAAPCASSGGGHERRPDGAGELATARRASVSQAASHVLGRGQQPARRCRR